MLFNLLEPYRAGIAKVRYGEGGEVEDAREMSVRWRLARLSIS